MSMLMVVALMAFLLGLGFWGGDAMYKHDHIPPEEDD